MSKLSVLQHEVKYHASAFVKKSKIKSMKILTFADLHLRSTVPSCIEATQSEWIDIQQKALDKVFSIAVENKVSYVYVGGDIFHSEQTASFECIIMFLEFCNRLKQFGIKVCILAGNHDLPNHSSSNIHKSAIGVVLNSDLVFEMDIPVRGCNFDEDNYDNAVYIFKHVLCMPREVKPEMVECETPETLLQRYPTAKIIFTGDYHKKFFYEQDNRYVVNSGCLTKQAVDFEDYETGVWLTDLSTCEFKWFPVNIPQKFNHNSEVKKEIDESIERFATSIKKESVTLDFISSVRAELPNHEKEVQNKVNSWIEKIGQ